MKKLKDYMEAQETTEVKLNANSVKLAKKILKQQGKTVTDKAIANLIKKLLEEEIKIANRGDV